MEIISTSETQTEALAAKIAKKSKAGDTLLLNGDLGSGKTVFVKGFANGLGIKKTITSPTFVVMKMYDIPHKKYKLVHVDCYRLKNEQDGKGICLPEIIGDDKFITLIEWPDRIKKLLPENSKTISFEYINEINRKISLP